MSCKDRFAEDLDAQLAAAAEAADSDRILLTAWRTVPLPKISRTSLINALLQVTPTGQEYAPLLARAQRGDGQAALEIADLIGGETDLCWSWITVAAQSGQGYAQAQLAAILFKKAQSAASSRNKREAARLYGLAQTALKSSKFLALLQVTGAGRTRALSQIIGSDREAVPSAAALNKAPVRRAAPAAADIPTEGPRLTVIQGEIPSLRPEDKALAEAWGSLTRPLPLAMAPDPTILTAALVIEMPWLDEAIDELLGDVRLRSALGQPTLHWRPTVLVGSPGTGKTRLGHRLAALAGVGFGELSVAGSCDNRLLNGTARGWGTAQPALPLQLIRRTGIANPILLVDEIDKARSSHNGDVRQTLLGMVEPQSARTWPDECLMVPTNLSAICWLMTANELEPLRGPLLTRLRVIEVPLPRPEHSDAIIAGIRRDIAAELHLRPEDLPDLPGAFERELRNGLRRGISVRRVRAGYERALKMMIEVGGSRCTPPLH